MIKNMPIKLIISFITIILLASVFYTPTSHAVGQIMEAGKNFLDVSNGENSVINEAVLHDTSNHIYNTLLVMAIIIAVIVAMILGIQFMIAAADEKAKVKEALMPFITGCVVVFGSFTIWKVLINVGNSAEQSIRGEAYYDTISEAKEYPFSEWYDKYAAGIQNSELPELAEMGLENMNWERFYNWMKEKNEMYIDRAEIVEKTREYLKEWQFNTAFDLWYADVKFIGDFSSDIRECTMNWDENTWRLLFEKMYDSGNIIKFDRNTHDGFDELKEIILAYGEMMKKNEEEFYKYGQYMDWYNQYFFKSSYPKTYELTEDWNKDQWKDCFTFMINDGFKMISMGSGTDEEDEKIAEEIEKYLKYRDTQE